eukprot:TRINITY_DN14317_c0_g3_i1.p1 TRINITY_DN14317_c0_g3~~TRINITY_DN14317_c0_g3_i1.p1  ORF type:complete len:227 (-),score=48.16 TRINITY_DN14317_c0_g3_i1:72-731(-)
MIRRPPRSTPLYSSAASDVYKRQERECSSNCLQYYNIRSPRYFHTTSIEMKSKNDLSKDSALYDSKHLKMIAVPSPFSPSYESTQERIFPSNSPFKFPEAKHRETKERSNEWSFRPVAKAVQEAPGKKLSPSKDTPYTEIARREMKVVRAIGPNAARILWESKMIREANKNSLVKLQSKYNSEQVVACLLYTSPSPRDRQKSRMPSSACKKKKKKSRKK